MGVIEILNAAHSSGRCGALPFVVYNNRIFVTRSQRRMHLWYSFIITLICYLIFVFAKSYFLYLKARSEQNLPLWLIIDLSLCLTWGLASSILFLAHLMVLRNIDDVTILANSFFEYLELFTSKITLILRELVIAYEINHKCSKFFRALRKNREQIGFLSTTQNNEGVTIIPSGSTNVQSFFKMDFDISNPNSDHNSN